MLSLDYNNPLNNRHLQNVNMMWFTTVEVAQELGVTTRTVERWRSSGVLTPEGRTKGNHSRYSEDQICQFKQQREEEKQIKLFQQMML